mmetsp:Transcript_3524/g.6676  ORF Transcript_3524/g.6676 Transcript_3524/m.6676 type:complete len:114 (-) Transcript_3524:191-532(-)
MKRSLVEVVDTIFVSSCGKKNLHHTCVALFSCRMQRSPGVDIKDLGVCSEIAEDFGHIRMALRCGKVQRCATIKVLQYVHIDSPCKALFDQVGVTGLTSNLKQLLCITTVSEM